MKKKTKRIIGWSILLVIFATLNILAFQGYKGFDKDIICAGDLLLSVYLCVAIASLLAFLVWCFVDLDSYVLSDPKD